MKNIRSICVVCVSVLFCACGSNNITCDEPQRYQASHQGERIVAPEGLDDLQQNREMKIPDASSGSERPPGSPCLERPPVYVSPDRQ